MGRDKARLRIGTRSLLAHVRALGLELGLPVMVQRRDAVPRCGPLGGVLSALQSTRADTVLFLACDMPLLTGSWPRKLLKVLPPNVSAAFTELDGVVGFPFIVRASGLPIVRQQIDAGQFSLQALARALQAARLIAGPDQKRALLNVNTPEELALARTAAEPNEDRTTAGTRPATTSRTRGPSAARVGKGSNRPPARARRRRPGTGRARRVPYRNSSTASQRPAAPPNPGYKGS